MTFAQIVILGIVQGASEFLPISSTAHLILLPKFLGFSDPGLVFDISLHLGTLLAILIYFRKEWMDLIGLAATNFSVATSAVVKKAQVLDSSSKKNETLPGKCGSSKIVDRHPLMIHLLIVATIPGLFLGILFESWAETFFRTPILMAATLAIFGLILWLADKRMSHLGDLGNLSRKKAFFIGCWQALAIIPGVSRSGAAITAGLLAGLKREAAVKFSFLLSAPIIAGSMAVGAIKLMNQGWMIDGRWWIGVLTSFVTGTLAIKFLLNFVNNHSFLPFVIYRLILAFLILRLI